MKPERLAQEYQLGALIDSFSWHRSWVKFAIVANLFLLPFALLFSFLIIGIPFLVLCVINIYSSVCKLYSGKVIFFYERGLIDYRKRHPKVIKYHDIQTLKTYIAKQYFMGAVYLYDQTIYTLILIDGRKLVFNHNLYAIERLGNLLGDKLVEQKLPAAIATLQQGESIEFGKLTVSQAGLMAAQKFLPWTELGAIYLVHSEYMPTLSVCSSYIKQDGELKQWKWFHLENIDNIPLLLVITDWIRGYQHTHPLEVELSVPSANKNLA